MGTLLTRLEPPERQAYRFGQFVLVPDRRELTLDNEPVRLRGREFDTLLVLVENAGQFVSKDELSRRVWGTINVSDNNVRVQIGALRRAIGDTVSKSRIIITVTGRGYCFCLPVTSETVPRSGEDPIPLAARAFEFPVQDQVPESLKSTVGREAATRQLLVSLPCHRLITVVGPGGIGKTTLATAVAQGARTQFADGVRFVDLAALSDETHVVSAIAARFGLPAATQTATEDLLNLLNDMDVLIVLDNCEHVIDAVAALTDLIMTSSQQVSILATSREPLRTDCEVQFRLAPLEIPESVNALSVDRALEFSAVRLFADRAQAGNADFQLSEADIPALIELLNKLDGNPLAIELSAARVDHFGIKGLLSRLEESFNLLASQRRSSLPRHQNLRAMLDWSYDLLVPGERDVLQALSVFRGDFTIESAAMVAGFDATPQTQADLLHILTELVTKSLIVSDVSQHPPRYRLLYLTRVYAQEQLVMSGRMAEATRRHALNCLRILQTAEANKAAGDVLIEVDLQRDLEDIRAAIDWAFSPAGDPFMGVPLMTNAIELGLKLSLYKDFSSLVDRAISHLRSLDTPQPHIEFLLLTQKFTVTMHVNGESHRMQEAIDRVVELCQQIEGGERHIDATFEPLYLMAAKCFSDGEYPELQRLAERLNQLAYSDKGTTRHKLIAWRNLAQAHHMVGEHRQARPYIDRVLDLPVDVLRPRGQYIGERVDPRISLRITLARIHWIEGRPETASAIAHEAVELAWPAYNHVLCYVLAFAAFPIAMWRGHRDEAREHLITLNTIATDQAMPYWQGWARALDAAHRLCVNADTLGWTVSNDSLGLFGGLGSLETLQPPQIDLLATLHPALCTDEAVERAERGLSGWCAAEVLRNQAEKLKARRAPVGLVERLLSRSLEIARDQGARGFERRTVTSLSALWMESGDTEKARSLLRSFGEFGSQGMDDADSLRLRAVMRQSEA